MGNEMNKGPVLLFTAHADDAEFFCGGTIARFAAQGRAVYEVIATNNERGSFELEAAELISQSRDREAREAARIIGKKEIYFLEYPDGFLNDYPLNEIREKFMRFVRKIKPYTVMTFDPWAPYESHPDHRVVGMAAVEAAGFAHLPLYHPEHIRAEGLQPHVVPEYYYFAKSPREANKIVDITETINVKINALCAHDSQMKLTVDDFRLSLTAAGVDADKLDMLDRDNYRPALEMYIKAWAGKVGERGGFTYGEEFRHDIVSNFITKITEA